MYVAGQIYNRKADIHAVYGGQRQGGISTPKDQPLIFLFTGDSGTQFGYKDGWDVNDVFIYTGEGQVGDMQFVGGNKAIRDHVNNGKALLLFESLGKGKGYRYLGDFVCSTWEFRTGIDREGANRNVIVFHLLLAGEMPDETPAETDKTITFEELRKKAYQAASPAAQASPRNAKQNNYQRSRDVKLYVLARASGVCECCGNAAPFERQNGEPYLEPHHTQKVSDGGPDHPRWVGAICPNCHREIHHGINGKEKNKALQAYLRQIES